MNRKPQKFFTTFLILSVLALINLSCSESSKKDNNDNTIVGPGPVQTPDSLPPSVSISNPSSNTTVSGIVTIVANATDNVGVVRVDFFVNGSKKGSRTSEPWEISWASPNDGNTHTIKAIAYDAAGNSSSPAEITVDTPTPSPTVEYLKVIGDVVDSAWITVYARIFIDGQNQPFDAVLFSGSVSGNNVSSPNILLPSNVRFEDIRKITLRVAGANSSHGNFVDYDCLLFSNLRVEYLITGQQNRNVLVVNTPPAMVFNPSNCAGVSAYDIYTR